MSGFRSILITGASSGIGRALAVRYAGHGVSLALGGRDAGRLDEVAAACRELGATVQSECVDVTDSAAMKEWLVAADRRSPLDLVMANAGVSAGTGGGGESPEQARRIFATNVDGVVNTVQPAIAAMRPRGRGHIGIMSSLAAFRGFPGAPAYCASKAAVRIYGESLRADLHRQGIAISVICPGFVKSAMTAVNDFPMPMLMETDIAARRIAQGLARGRARIAFPWPLYAAVRLFGGLPPALTDPLMVRLPRKS